MAIVFFLLVIVAPLVVCTEVPARNEIYRKKSGELGFGFTVVDHSYVQSKIQCLTKCIGDSTCLGVGIHDDTNWRFECSKLNNDSTGLSIRPDGLIYLKVVQEEGKFGHTSCPAPFRKFGDLSSCYYLVLEDADWTDAEAACQGLNSAAHLISFESTEEREVISQHFKGISDQGSFWTGGKDQNGDNELTWIGTGETIPDDADYWLYDNPEHAYGDCVFMYSNTNDMNTNHCSIRYSYVCEIH